MKTSFLKIYIFCFVLLSDFMTFAQLPTDDGDGELQADDEPAVSIGKQMIWLIVAGIIFAYYRLKPKSQLK